MSALDDLFPETLPDLSDADAARELALAIVRSWFGTLNYAHNESTHREILDSLVWPGMREFVEDAGIAIDGRRVDFYEFAAGVRAQARRARAAGLVVPDKRPRQRRAAVGVGADLFGGVQV